MVNAPIKKKNIEKRAPQKGRLSLTAKQTAKKIKEVFEWLKKPNN